MATEDVGTVRPDGREIHAAQQGNWNNEINIQRAFATLAAMSHR